jgi:hydrogenase maturation factor HypF (carbamoyltransferase family)
MNELEDYTKNVGLTDGNSSLITSVASRENASITKYNAGDLVINIKVSGDQEKIDSFLNLLNNIPFVSYIEKIDIKFDYINKKHNANIILIIYQKHESK